MYSGHYDKVQIYFKSKRATLVCQQQFQYLEIWDIKVLSITECSSA